MARYILLSTSCLLLALVQVWALDNGLARLPHMGWNDYNAFGCDYNDELLLNTGQKLIDLGLKDLGYDYVLVDDCWSKGRNSTGHLIPDAYRFPKGIKYVADQLHSMGLKFGIYSDAGSLTCARAEGSLGHEEIDAQTWASWGVDYLKYDNCYNEGQSGTPALTYKRFKKMSDALNATGRPILYSMCNWGEDSPWQWAQTVANSWRMSGDIIDNFNMPDLRCPCEDKEELDCKLAGSHCSVMNILNKAAWIADKGGPGNWNDLDMLEVGNGKMTDDEYVAHFSLWAILKSPLILGTDLRNIKPSTLSIISNPAVIALSQDPSTQVAMRRWRHYVEKDRFGQGEIQLWSGNLVDYNVIVLLLNAGDVDRTMEATAEDIFRDNGGKGSWEITRRWEVWDVWGNRMDDKTAEDIINGNAASVADTPSGKQLMYNATAMGGYGVGLKQNSSVLFGKKIATLQPGQSLFANVKRHGVRVFRLREAKDNIWDTNVDLHDQYPLQHPL